MFFSFTWRVWLDAKQDGLPTIYIVKDNLLDMRFKKKCVWRLSLYEMIQLNSIKKQIGNFPFKNCSDEDISVNFDLIFNLTLSSIDLYVINIKKSSFWDVRIIEKTSIISFFSLYTRLNVIKLKSYYYDKQYFWQNGQMCKGFINITKQKPLENLNT